MPYIKGKYVAFECANCEFWTPCKLEGRCSQHIKTDNGLVQPITFHDHLCSLHQEDVKKFDFRLWIDKENNIHITGVFSKNTLLKAKEFIDNKLKETL